jgi:ribosomal protein S8
MTKSQILTVLIDKYISVVLSVKKRKLNEPKTMSKLSYIKQLEGKIESIQPITRYQKRLFEDYLEYKNKIDLMIFPEGLPWLRTPRRNTAAPPFIIEVDRRVLENTKKIQAVEEKQEYRIIDDNSGIVVDKNTHYI